MEGSVVQLGSEHFNNKIKNVIKKKTLRRTVSQHGESTQYSSSNTRSIQTTCTKEPKDGQTLRKHEQVVATRGRLDTASTIRASHFESTANPYSVCVACCKKVYPASSLRLVSSIEILMILYTECYTKNIFYLFHIIQ